MVGVAEVELHASKGICEPCMSCELLAPIRGERLKGASLQQPDLGLRDAPADVVASSRGKQPRCPVSKHEQAHGSRCHERVVCPLAEARPLIGLLDLSFTLCKISILPLVLGLLLRTLFPFLRRWRRTLPSGPVSGVPAVRPGGARGPQEAQQEASGEAHVGRILRCGCGSRQARLFVPGLLRRKAGGGAALQARAGRQMLHRLGGRHRIHHRQAHRQAVQGLPVSPVNIMDRGIPDFNGQRNPRFFMRSTSPLDRMQGLSQSARRTPASPLPVCDLLWTYAGGSGCSTTRLNSCALCLVVDASKRRLW